MADERDKGYLDFIETEFREQQRALLLAFGKWRVKHGMTAFLEMDVDAFLAGRAQSEDPRTALPPEVEAVLRDPNVRLVGEESALKRATDYVLAKAKAAGELVYKDTPPATTMSAQPGAPLVCVGCGLVYGDKYPCEPSVMRRDDGSPRCNDCANSIAPKVAAISVNPIEELLKANGVVSGYEHERTLREILAKLGVYPPRVTTSSPQQFWRVLLQNWSAAAISCDRDGRLVWQMGPWHSGPDCEEDAANDGRASKLPEWKEGAR